MARRTKEEALATRAALLDATERLFEQRGVSQTTLADIARGAGVTRGALYWHFKDKSDLFNAMLERVALPLSMDPAQLERPAAELLQAWFTHQQRALHQIATDAQTQRVLRVAMQKVEHAGEMIPTIAHHVHLDRRNVEIIDRMLEASASAQHMRLAVPARQLANALHAMMHGLIYRWLLESSFDLEATGRTAIAVFLRGCGLALPPDIARAVD